MAELTRWTRSPFLPAGLAQRARIVLLADEAGGNPINNTDTNGADFLGDLEDIGAAIGVVTAAVGLVTLAPEATLLEGGVAAFNFATSAGAAAYDYSDDLAE